MSKEAVLEGVMEGDDFYTYDGRTFRRLRRSSNFGQPTTTSGTPPTGTPQSTTTPSPLLSTDLAGLHSIINALRTELKATTSVNSDLAASVARLQADLNTTTTVNINLEASITRLQAELTDTIISVNNHLAASVARLQAEQNDPHPTSTTPTPAATPTPDLATTPPITAPLPRPHPHHPHTITASGCGAASPEVFQEIIKTNWHGRLGRTHMVDVDALSSTALTELDSLLRRKLHAVYPRGSDKTSPNTDAIFASLAALGLRLEGRSAYADVPVVGSATLNDEPTTRRVRNSVVWNITKGYPADYWQGVLLETLLELAKYRGLFDGEGYLKEE